MLPVSLLRSFFNAALLLTLAAAPALASGFDRPAGAKFSQAKLQRITDFLNAEIAAKKIPGAILLIQQHGQPVYFEKLGVRDLATGLPMTDDTVFRLHSMTKPVTSFAAMMLVDQGKLRLDEPLSTYIPSFAGAQVGLERGSDSGEKVLGFEKPRRPITIKDLLLHTSGITYGFYGEGLVRNLYGNADIYQGNYDNAEFVERIAQLPLAEQPGTLWDYGHSTDVLGRVIEIASGQSLFAFQKQHLFDPLGMTATEYFIRNAEHHQLMARSIDEDSDFRDGAETSIQKYKTWESGGGGLFTTITDYARFAQMLLNGGTLDGRRYLGPETFRLMTTDHIGKASGVARDYYYFPGDGFGFGLGFGVRTDPGEAKPPPPGSLGELKWDGASGCYFVIDRKQDFFFVLLEQTPSERHNIQTTVKRLVYDALQD
jgi:CubicO group peptidase (beta-lactamase class C family)